MKRLVIDGTKPGPLDLRIEDNNSPWGWFIQKHMLMQPDDFSELVLQGSDRFVDFLKELVTYGCGGKHDLVE
jgi:hypothetical protein